MPPARRNRPLLPWCLALALAATATRAADADAVEGPAAAAPAAYTVKVEAPAALKDAIEREVGIVRWQTFAGMTDDLLDRLAREAIDETRNLVAAEGWFSPKIDVTIDRTTSPPTVTLSVVLGEPTRIASVKIDVTGPAKTDVPAGTDAIAQHRARMGPARRRDVHAGGDGRRRRRRPSRR